jgi:hypothetical protein
LAGRRGPRYRRVCGYAGRYPGTGGRHGSANRKQCEQRIFVGSQLASISRLENFHILGARENKMYVSFLLFVMVIVLVLIFWELSKINSLLKKSIVSPHDTAKGIKTRNPEDQ